MLLQGHGEKMATYERRREPFPDRNTSTLILNFLVLSNVRNKFVFLSYLHVGYSVVVAPAKMSNEPNNMPIFEVLVL